MNGEEALLLSAGKVEAAARFLQSQFLVAQIVEGVQSAVRRQQIPWLTRKEAAEYARCSVSELDRAAEKQFIKKHVRGGTPLFTREEIDAAIKSGAWKSAG